MKDTYLGMKQGDLDGKPYAKYWNPQMQLLQPQMQAAVLHGPFASGLGLKFEEAAHLLKPGYLPLENGYTQLENGQYLIACLTNMPGVTGEMFEWWMGWHYMEAQRYKLWHPQAHLANGTAEMQGDNPDLSNREKYQTTHFVTEYMGNNPSEMTITFSPTQDFLGLDSDPYTDEVTALVCGRIALKRPALTIGYLIHQIRQIDGGAEMRSRFWLGKPELPNAPPNGLRNRLLASRWLMNLVIPKTFARDVLVQCGTEMNHLSGFLPDLYADYHAT